MAHIGVYLKKNVVDEFLESIRFFVDRNDDSNDHSFTIKIGYACMPKCSISPFAYTKAKDIYYKAYTNTSNNVEDLAWKLFCIKLYHLQNEWVDLFNNLVPFIHPHRRRISIEYKKRFSEFTSYVGVNNHNPPYQEAFQSQNPQYSSDINVSVKREEVHNNDVYTVVLCNQTNHNVLPQQQNNTCLIDMLVRVRYKKSMERFYCGFYCLVKNWSYTPIDMFCALSKDTVCFDRMYSHGDVANEYKQYVSKDAVFQKYIEREKCELEKWG